MHISYANEELRDYCFSLIDKSPKSPFTNSEDIVQVRALLADLRSAPRLSEAPVSYVISEVNGNIVVTVTYENIKINCMVIPFNNSTSPEQIKRLKIIEILNSDLQISTIKDRTA